MTLLIPVSWGELLDKITILEIKSSRIIDVSQLKNIRNELQLLREVAEKSGNIDDTANPALKEIKADLRRVNETLWDIEDAIRECERTRDFGHRFRELARAVYRQNDKRAALKKQINHLLGSDLIEEKSYRNY